MSKWTLLALTFCLANAAPSVAATPANNMAVFPATARSLPPISLSELVYQAIPAQQNTDFGWDLLQIPAIAWQTDGIDTSRRNLSFREGIARVRAGGVTSRILRRNWEELAWRVRLYTDGPAHRGPIAILFEPGFDEPLDCFGAETSGCKINAAAIRSAKVILTLACKAGGVMPDNFTEVYRARTSDGRIGTLAIQTNGGTGGVHSQVEILAQTPHEACAIYMRRGF